MGISVGRPPFEPSINVHPVESIEPDLNVSGLEDAARAFRRVWSWCARPADPRDIGIRHLTAAWLLGQRPDIHTQAQLGKICRVTRAEISRLGTEFSRTFGIKFAQQNSLENRERCRLNRFR